MLNTKTAALSFVLWPLLASAFAVADTGVWEDFSHRVALNRTASGGYLVAATLGGVQGEFLLDTGASMITVSREFFEAMTARGAVGTSRKVAARLASGRLETMDVYRVSQLTLGEECHVGPVEVAVLKRGGRNLLGMSALTLAAPFAIYPSASRLGLSQCGPGPGVAAR